MTLSKYDTGQTGACFRITLQVKNNSLQVKAMRLTKRSSHHEVSDTFPFEKVPGKDYNLSMFYLT